MGIPEVQDVPNVLDCVRFFGRQWAHVVRNLYGNPQNSIFSTTVPELIYDSPQNSIFLRQFNELIYAVPRTVFFCGQSPNSIFLRLSPNLILCPQKIIYGCPQKTEQCFSADYLTFFRPI